MIEEFLTLEVLISVVFVSLGSYFYFYNLWNFRIARQSILWPKTTGTVLKSQVNESWSTIRENSQGRTRMKRNYIPEIHYSYNVNDQTYHSSQIFIGDENYSTNSRTRAYNYTRKYPTGKKVMVHYIRNIYQIPDKEKYSVLEPGVKLPVYLGLFAGLLSVTIGGSISFYKYSTTGVLLLVPFHFLGRGLNIWLRRRHKKNTKTHSPQF